MFKLRLFFFGLILLPFFSFSQKDFVRGYVITLKGDTINGYVYFKDISNTPNQCLLKINDTSILQKYSKENCIAFGSYEGSTYQRHLVNISLSKVRSTDLSIGIDTLIKREEVFLKLLHGGKNINFYVYTDEIKTRFYTKEGTSEPEELLFYSFFNPIRESQVVNRSLYQTQLQHLFKKYNAHEPEPKIARTLYNMNDISKIVMLINGSAPITIKKNGNPRRRRFIAYAGLGASYLTTDYEAKEQFLIGTDIVSKKMILPFVSAGVDINIGNVFVRLDAEVNIISSKQVLSVSKNDITELKHYGDRLEFKQYTATFSSSLLRNLYSSKRLNFYAGLGIALRYASTNDNNRFFNYSQTVELIYPGADFKETTFQIPISTGVILFKKIDASLTYMLPSKINNNSIYNIKSNKTKFGINYRF